MGELATYAALAEIFGVATIVVAAIFGFIQYRDFHKRRMGKVAADLASRFSQPEFARAVALLKRLPDNMSYEEMEAAGEEYVQAAYVVSMAIETMGLMIHEDIACFRMTQELTGGLVQTVWKKVGVWIQQSRIQNDDPEFGEWTQWLTERLIEDKPNATPAYEAYRSWKPPRN